MLAHAIETARSADIFAEVMVSTDSEVVAKIAREYGARVPFLRSAATAADDVGLADVVIEVLSSYESRGFEFEAICCLYATAALLRPERLREGYRDFLGNGIGSISIQPFDYPMQRSLVRGSNGIIKMVWPENYAKRSQDLERHYHDAGQFVFIEKHVLLRQKRLIVDGMIGVILNPFEAQDIDDQYDWEIAELKHAILSRKKG